MVEFHAFKDNNDRFIVKEFAIVNQHFRCHLVFDPPYSFNVLSFKMQRMARWLSHRFHLIRWDAKGIPYDEDLIKNLCNTFQLIYTKGLEKTKFLSEFHPEVHDIAQYCVTSHSDLPLSEIHCLVPQHSSNANAKCAMRSALLYHNDLIQFSSLQR